MAQLIIPIDVEDALRIDIDSILKKIGKQVKVSAPPLTPDLEKNIPYCMITKTSGWDTDMVLNSFAVSFDVYDRTWAKAMDTASTIYAIINALPYIENLGTDWKDTVGNSSPNTFPDPDNPLIPRVRFSMTVRARSIIRDI